MSESTRRKRGGQPGNANRLRHGFYSRQFTAADCSDLDRSDHAGLKDEIALARVSIRNIHALIQQRTRDFTPQEIASLYRTLAYLLGHILRLTRGNLILSHLQEPEDPDQLAWDRAAAQGFFKDEHSNLIRTSTRMPWDENS